MNHPKFDDSNGDDFSQIKNLKDVKILQLPNNSNIMELYQREEESIKEG
jgi:hypothetical protein